MHPLPTSPASSKILRGFIFENAFKPEVVDSIKTSLQGPKTLSSIHAFISFQIVIFTL